MWYKRDQVLTVAEFVWNTPAAIRPGRRCH
jgi:hypothetical protein